MAIIDHGAIIVQGSTKELLARLHTETFVLNLRNPLAKLPTVEGYAVTRVDETTLEVEVNKEQDINALFASLSKAGVQVLSMRNKANRLEELFVRLTERKGDGR